MSQYDASQLLAIYAAVYAKNYKDWTSEDKATAKEYNSLFTFGRRFRTLVPFHLRGMQLMSGGGMTAYQGWSTTLPPGTVLTCDGVSKTFGDGVPAVKWLDADGTPIAMDCCAGDIVGGMWGGQLPRPGQLEVI